MIINFIFLIQKSTQIQVQTTKRELYQLFLDLQNMTMLLEKAFSEANKLGPENQDTLAAIIIEEILAERKWDEAFARSHDKLTRLADEALAETRNGKAKPLAFN